MRSILFAIAVVCGFAVQGQVFQVQPTTPTSADRIYLHVGVGLNGPTPLPIEIVGSEIRITFRGVGSVLPFGVSFVLPVGPLPAGTYQVLVRFEYLDDEGNPDYTIVSPPYILVVAPAVSPAYIPALSPAALTLFAAAMAVGGAFLLRR